ncbi:tyrosinase family protein [Chthonomonas calidirosea]|uniref:tyrosinase family protein n=1 Tax=Chthonomonas calidirosea TaxID=454171 RepID=UPI0006ECB8EC|nr:tyrosinase family protein [Chthonomonas calidirosea]CEK20382.1 tyrosinase family protein [Chthonomonas calidirosea]
MCARTTNLERQMADRQTEHLFDLIDVNPTFTHHLLMRGGQIGKVLKLPPWLVAILTQQPYARKDQLNLTDHEKERFLCAYSILNANGTLGNLVAIHAQMHQQHGTIRFLPWHRVFLLQLEMALRAIHPDVAIPYWDWTNPQEQSIPAWLQNVTPTVNTPNGPISVVRAPGSPADLATTAANVPSILQNTTFNDFTFQLEGVHDFVHVWVGGSMSSIPTAPADPIFWMHHANIDRLWWLWHVSAQGQGKNPNLSGLAAQMDPWNIAEPQTRDIGALGYTYQ